MDIANALKYQREYLGISKTQLSKETGISVQNISRWERNEALPNIEFCKQLANYYGVTIEELIGAKD